MKGAIEIYGFLCLQLAQSIKALRKVLVLELLRTSMELPLTWHRADGLSILHWSPIASIDTLHKLIC